MLTNVTNVNLKILTIEPTQPFWPLFLRQVDAEVVDWYTRESNGYSNEGIDCVTIEGHDDQEKTAQAIDEGNEQCQLEGRRPKRQKIQSINVNNKV